VTIPRVVVLLSQIAGNGGIPRYNRLFCKCLTEYQRQRPIRLDVVSLNDPPAWHDTTLLQAAVTGCDGNRPGFVFQAVRSLLRRYSLVIVGHVDLGPVALPPHLMRRGASMLTLVHGEEVWTRLPWHERAALHKSDVVWAVSSHTKGEIVQRQGVRASRVQIVPNVLDPDFAADASRAAGEAVRSRLLTVSRLSRSEGGGKGVDHVISALPLIRSEIPDVDFTIVGGGDDMPRLRKLAESLNVGDIVTFAGQVSDRDLGKYLSGTDVFVLPSRQEGFGIVFLEAMAHGKPVIAGAHGGSPEVVLDGATGKLVRYGDQPALVQAITALLRDVGMRNAMGAAGAERVRTTFHYDRFRSAVFAMLDDILTESHGSR